MKFGLDVPTTDAYADARVLAQLAADAEAAGWDGFFVWDVLSGIDPWIALAAIALQTSRIRIGFMVLPLGRHHPWLVAKRLADLDHVSQGRVTCTVGLGGGDFTPFGETPDLVTRAQKLDEGLTILNGLWTQEPFSFAGAHYTLHEVSLSPKPVQAPRIPLWVAGGWPRRAPFRRAARWDGVCFMSNHMEAMEWLTIEDFRAGVAYVQTHRNHQAPLEVVMSGDTSGDHQRAIAKVRAFQEAGATWWVEEGLDWPLEEFRDRIRNGPPRA